MLLFLLASLGAGCRPDPLQELPGYKTPVPAEESALKKLVMMDSPAAKYRFDSASSGQSRLPGPEKMKILWEFSTGGAIQASGVIDQEGRFLVGSYDCNIYCISPDGEMIWKTSLPEWIDSTGILSSDGRFFVGCDDGNLVALDSRGNIQWKYDLRAEISSSPAITLEGFLVVGSEDGNLYAFDGLGRQMFSFRCPRRILVSSPLVTDKDHIIFGAEDHHLYCIDMRGKLIWKYRATDPVTFNSPPVLWNNRVIFTTPNKDMICLEADSGEGLWKIKIHEEVFSPLSVDSQGRIYAVALDGLLTCHSPDGELLWKFWLGREKTRGPTVDSHGRVYVSAGGKLHCIDSGGNPASVMELDEGIFSTEPVVGPGNRIYMGTEDGRIICIGSEKE